MRSPDDAQQRRLAAAGRPDERDELAPADVQVDVLERHGRLAALDGERLLDARQSHRAGRGDAGAGRLGDVIDDLTLRPPPVWRWRRR